jgi:UDP-glucose:(heptosyl)LPS alpha-1,3-glucosyltransferase
MDLAFVAKSIDGRGGTERDLLQLAAGLAGRGHAVTLYLLRAGGPVPPGCRVVRVPVLGFDALARLWSLAWLGPRLAFRGGHDLVTGFARLLRQDVVRCGGGTHAAFLETLGKVQSPARAAFRRLHPLHRSILSIERRQYRPGHFRRVLAISETVKGDLMRTYGLPESAIRVIPDGVDTGRLNLSLRGRHRAAVRVQFGIPPDAPCVLFLGNGFRRKGLDVLIQAFARIPEPAWHLLVAGADPETNAYRALAARLGVAARVRFAGYQPDPAPLYAAADLLALPAVQEAFGNVVLEALACGLPVAVSRGAGVAGLLRNEPAAGLLDDPRDPDELAARLSHLYGTAADGSAAGPARRLAETYSHETNTTAVEALLEEVLREKRSAQADLAF